MQKISKNHGFQVEFTSLSPKNHQKNHQKNQQDFSPFPWSGHLVDPFDPTVLRPQARGLPFRNNESLQHSYLSKVNIYCRQPRGMRMLVEQKSHLDKSKQRLSYWDWLLEVSFRFWSGASDSREEKPGTPVLNEGLTCPNETARCPTVCAWPLQKDNVSNSKGVENQQEEKATLLHTNCIVLRAP